DADGKFANFKPALDVAKRVGNGLAVLAREQCGEGLLVAAQQLDKTQEHTGADLRILGGPRGLRNTCIKNRCRPSPFGCKADPRLHFARVRVVDIAEPAALSGDPLSGNEVSDLSDHAYSPAWSAGSRWIWRRTY